MNCTRIPFVSCSSKNGICHVRGCKAPVHDYVVMDDDWIASHMNAYLAAVIKESVGDIKGVYPAAFRYLKNHPDASKQIDPRILYDAYRRGKV